MFCCFSSRSKTVSPSSSTENLNDIESYTTAQRRFGRIREQHPGDVPLIEIPLKRVEYYYGRSLSMVSNRGHGTYYDR
ncbi:hypothetical protein BGW42_005167 [Actinomortierella wolfii]|nr:hypothetical protein BGW42_005167 [Actinomortierella wolfii]